MPIKTFFFLNLNSHAAKIIDQSITSFQHWCEVIIQFYRWRIQVRCHINNIDIWEIFPTTCQVTNTSDNYDKLFFSIYNLWGFFTGRFELIPPAIRWSTPWTGCQSNMTKKKKYIKKFLHQSPFFQSLSFFSFLNFVAVFVTTEIAFVIILQHPSERGTWIFLFKNFVFQISQSTYKVKHTSYGIIFSPTFLLKCCFMALLKCQSWMYW